MTANRTTHPITFNGANAGGNIGWIINSATLVQLVIG